MKQETTSAQMGHPKAFELRQQARAEDRAAQIPDTPGTLDESFDHLVRELRLGNRSPDIAGADRALTEIARLVASVSATSTDLDCEQTLLGLVGLYSRGAVPWGGRVFAETAPAYAAVIEALSRRNPTLDYHEPVGQLLELMIHLFKIRNSGWKLVYTHLRSIPDSVQAKQVLQRACSADIHEWFEAGVYNLFSLQDNLNGRIDSLTRELEEIQEAIEDAREHIASLRRARGLDEASNVVLLEEREIEREITALQEELQITAEERERKRETAALIDSDIREFEEILRATRRGYFVRRAR